MSPTIIEFIHKLRLQPERKRRQIAFLVSLGIAGIIMAIWFSVTVEAIANVSHKITANPKPEVTASVAGTANDPLADIKGDVNNAVHGMDATFAFIKNFSTTTTSTDPSLANSNGAASQAQKTDSSAAPSILLQMTQSLAGGSQDTNTPQQK